MAYDEGLAQRIRELLEDDPRISEKKMFGGVAFFAHGKMAAGIVQDELMVHVGPDAHDDAIARPHARPMDFTGRPMRGFVQVAPAGFEDDAELRAWLARGIAYAEKQARKPPAAGRAAKSKKAGKPAATRRRPSSSARPRSR
ncbi:MAG TPA: TfoX/Sxy family protein [Myxococcota bacterium]|nr:TfoX/Sxy family protein [Myxococcota bacterium]